MLQPLWKLKNYINCCSEQDTKEVMRDVLKRLNQIAKILLKCHDINCCSEQDTKHLKFQCGFSNEHIIMGYHCYNYEIGRAHV